MRTPGHRGAFRLLIATLMAGTACGHHAVQPVATEDSWVVGIFSSARVLLADALVLPNDSVVVSGLFGGTATFGLGEPEETVLSTERGWGRFVALYQPNGQLRWALGGGRLLTSVTGLERWFDQGFLIGGACPASDSVEWAMETNGGCFVDLSSSGEIISTARFEPNVGGNLTSAASYRSAAVHVFSVQAGQRDGVPAIRHRLTKYALSGNAEWSFEFGGTNLGIYGGITMSPTGDTIVASCFDGTAQFADRFGPTHLLDSTGCYDMFVARYDASGRLLWLRTAGGTDCDCSGAVALRDDESVVVTGQFYGAPMTFDRGGPAETTLRSPSPGMDLFLAAYDRHGQLLWARSDGGGRATGTDVAVLTDGTIAVIAGAGYEASFGPNTWPIRLGNETSGAVVWYDTNGRVVGAERIGNGEEPMFSTKVVRGFSDGSALLAGHFVSDTTFRVASGEVTLSGDNSDNIYLMRTSH